MPTLTTSQMVSLTLNGIESRIVSSRVNPAISIQGEAGALSRVPFSLAEGSTPIGTMQTLSVRRGGTKSWSIVGGEDEGAFVIGSDGGLAFKSAPSTAVPADNNGDNVYLVRVRVDFDGGVYDEADVEVTVTGDAPESGSAPPVFTSSAAITVTTADTAVTTAVAVPPDIEYSVSGGADAALFEIEAAHGLLRFKVAPDYASPADADTSNDYVVEVTASDGARSDSQTITVNVTAAVSLGSELWAQPEFDAGTGFTVVGANWTIADGYALSDNGLGAISMYVAQAPGLTVGHTYRCVLALDEITNGWVRHAWDGENLDYDQVTAAGVHVADFVATKDQLSIYGANSTGIARVLYYSVKEVL